MYSELTNLIPEDRLLLLRRDYFIRLAVLGLFLLTILVGVGIVLLIPSYVYVAGQVSVKETRLQSIESSLALSDETSLEARLGRLAAETSRLSSLAPSPTGSLVISRLLAVTRSGIKISGFVFTPEQAGKPGTLVVAGASDTRDHLRAYQLALLASPFIKSAELPISAYAKDNDISFTITVTLAPQKP